VVDVGVGDDDLRDLQVRLLHGERDAGCLVAGVEERAGPRRLVSHDVAVLLERATVSF
jgi:hypothetical protein